MPLPNLMNEVPKYQVVLPSLKKEITYRPFLVKEQKILLMALETRDTKQIIQAMMNCIESCAPGTSPYSLATFDADYLFTQIRSKSIGETATISHGCENTECSHKNDIVVKLSDIKLNQPVSESVVDITDKIRIRLKYPTYQDMLTNENIFADDLTTTGILFETLMLCLDSVMTEDEQVKISEESKESIEQFVGSLNNQQLEKLQEFVGNMPRLTHSQDYECEKCGHKNTLEISGVRDFF